MAQGGDAADSMYGGTFEDEGFQLKHGHLRLAHQEREHASGIQPPRVHLR